MNPIDRVVEIFSPENAFKRARYRSRMAQVRSLPKSIRGSDRGHGSELRKTFNRKHVESLVKHNPYASKGLSVLTTYVVGTGIKPHAIYENQETSKSHEDTLKIWADGSHCDLFGKHNLYSLQRLAVRHLIRDGEVFVIATLHKTVFPLKLQVVGVDALSDIGYDDEGKPYSYSFLTEDGKTKEVEASRVAHVFDAKNAGDKRGESWFVPVLKKMDDFDIYEDAELTKQKIAACFSGYYRDLEAGFDDGDENKKEEPTEITPGSLLHAPPGKTIEWSNPPSVEGYGPYIQSVLTAISAGLNIPYMLLTGDYSKINYSSSRMAMLNFNRFISEVQELIIIPQLCDRIGEWFLEACELIGVESDVNIIWSTPKKDLVDPLKDYQSYALAVEQGFMSHAAVIRELGDDPQDVYKEIKKIEKQFKKSEKKEA